MKPKLGIIIPCYNMGAFVSEAIESVLSYPIQEEIEIIVVNDGSNDDNYTANVLNGYTQTNVTIIHQDNKGLGNARNTGIRASRSPYCLLLDADNRIRHNYIDQGISVLDKNQDVGVVYADLNRFGLENRNVQVGEFDASKLLVKNYIDACVVLRKSAWESVKGYDEHMPVMGYEDWDLNIRLFLKGWNFEYVKEVLYDYRVRENSMLINSNKNKDLLLSYMFSKPEMEQAAYLRNKIVAYFEYKDAFEKMKKRKVINTAIKIEKPIKSFYKLFKK